MKKTRRTSRVGDVIRTELSAIIQRELSDPDIGFVTVMDVELSTDLQYARVFISAFGDPAAQKASIKALEKSMSKIRYLLGRRASLRYTPELDFKLDTTANRASRIEKILKDVIPETKDETKDDKDGND